MTFVAKTRNAPTGPARTRFQARRSSVRARSACCCARSDLPGEGRVSLQACWKTCSISIRFRRTIVVAMWIPAHSIPLFCDFLACRVGLRALVPPWKRACCTERRAAQALPAWRHQFRWAGCMLSSDHPPVTECGAPGRRSVGMAAIRPFLLTHHAVRNEHEQVRDASAADPRSTIRLAPDVNRVAPDVNCFVR